MIAARVEALTVLTSVLFISERRRLVDLAAKHRLPAVSVVRDFVDDGRQEEAHKHLTAATTMYREMDMRFLLEQAETELRELR